MGADGRITVQFNATSPPKANAALAGKTLSLPEAVGALSPLSPRDQPTTPA